MGRKQTTPVDLTEAREVKARVLASGGTWYEAHKEYMRVRHGLLRASHLTRDRISFRGRYADPDTRNRRNLKKRAEARLYRYGLSEDQFQALLTAQKGACRICRVPFDSSRRATTPCIDHDHQAPRLVRGVLCDHCNLALGHSRDDTQVLQAAITYLKRPRPNIPVLPTPKPSSQADRTLKCNHGINTAERYALWVAQDGRCAITGEAIPSSGPLLHVDHDHTQNGRASIRGLLSRRANALLGFSKESEPVLQEMIRYLCLGRDV